MHHHRYARAITRVLHPAPTRRRSCGKRWYGDRIAADLALARIRARGQALGKDPVRSYLCPGRDGWHLTSAPRCRQTGPLIPCPRTESSSAYSPQQVVA